jgi:hypothetical protein
VGDRPIVAPPLVPELADLLAATERDVLRAIVRDGDILDGFKARLLSAAHGLPDEGEAAWLLVPLSPATMDALAAFEADEADLEEEPDLEEGGDLEPSLGATNDKNQEKAWRSPTYDLEYDGDGVADPDLEPNLGATNCGNPIVPQTLWAVPAPEECEEENEHGEGSGGAVTAQSTVSPRSALQRISISERLGSNPRPGYSTARRRERSTTSNRQPRRSIRITPSAPRCRKPLGD